jgi:hypothetical protein
MRFMDREAFGGRQEIRPVRPTGPPRRAGWLFRARAEGVEAQGIPAGHPVSEPVARVLAEPVDAIEEEVTAMLQRTPS